MPHFMIVIIPYINLSNISWIVKCLFLINMESLTLSVPRQKSVDPDETAHNEPVYQELRCLTFSLSFFSYKLLPIQSTVC